MARLPIVGSDNDAWGALVNSWLVPEFNTQTGVAYTLALDDLGKMVGMNNAAGNTLTVPPNASVLFAVGSIVALRQVGAGQTTIVGGGGVTVNSRGGALKLAGQYAHATLVKVATDTWELLGDVTV